MNPNIPHDGDASPLPEMETYEDARALAEKEDDYFFVAAFELKRWLTELLTEGFTRLAPEKRQPCGSPQSGLAWRGFIKIFGHVPDGGFPTIMGLMHRFIQYTDPLPELLLRSQVPVLIEQRLTGTYTGMRARHVRTENSPPTVPMMRQMAERWCEWLDATIHLETHGHCKLSGSRPDLELKSEIVAFGAPLCWLPSPEQLANPRHSESEAWPRREVETLLIGLQPVAKCNHWTTGELLKVVRTMVSEPLAYPCWSEADLISYRDRDLALPPLPPGPVPGKDLFPVGFDVALSLCPPLNGNPLAQPLWS